MRRKRMITSKDGEEILHFINNKILESKRKYSPIIVNLVLSRIIPNLSNIATEIPQCAMDYTLKGILDFLIKAERDGRIRK